MILSHRILIFGFWISLLGCGSGSVIEQIQKNKANAGNLSGNLSLSLAAGEKVYVAAAFYTDPVGSVATVGLSNPHDVASKLVVTDSSDVVIRSFDNKLFVINRGVTSTIQAIDPDTFQILGNYSVEPSSNPHDLAVANGKAFISRYDSNLAQNKDDLWVVHPTTGNLIASINLKPYTTDDGDRLARADQMALVGNFLYVLLQDLSSDFKATTNGKVAVIDTRTNEVTQSIGLSGRNPTSVAYHANSNRLFITDTGVFGAGFSNDVNTAYGGIEVINPSTNKTLGILIDDKDFGGYLFSIAFASSSLGVATVRAESVATFDPVGLKVINTSLYTTPSGFMPEVLAANGLVWIPERNPSNDGMVLLNPNSGAVVAGPFPIGALPASMTLIK